MKTLWYAFLSFLVLTSILDFVDVSITLRLAICFGFPITLLYIVATDAKDKAVHEKPTIGILVPCILTFIIVILGILGFIFN